MLYAILCIMKLLNSTEMANVLGMTKQSFGAGVKTGRFTAQGRGKFGHPLFNPAVVKKQYEATRAAAEIQDHARNLPPELRGGRPAKKKKEDIKDVNTQHILKAKLAKEIAQTQTLNFKLKVQSGLYIEKAEAMKQGVKLAEMVMGVLQSWPSRLAPELAAMRDCDEHDFHQRLEEEVNILIIMIRKQGGCPER